MTRASYAGGQRYAVTWTGDNSSTWDHLKLAVAADAEPRPVGLRLVGRGHPGLHRRCIARSWRRAGSRSAAFTPVFRSHAANDAPRAEPWVDGPEHLAIRRRFIEERYRLMPYFYAVAEQSARTGDPVMRPTFYDYPEMPRAPVRPVDGVHASARDLLVAASPQAGIAARLRHLPAGQGLVRLLDRAARLDGGARGSTGNADARPAAGVRPRRARSSPRQPLVQSTAETPKGPLELHVYPGEDCRGELYLDDGVSIGGPSLAADRPLHRHRQGGVMLQFGPREGSVQAVVEADRGHRPRLDGQPSAHDHRPTSRRRRAIARSRVTERPSQAAAGCCSPSGTSPSISTGRASCSSCCSITPTRSTSRSGSRRRPIWSPRSGTGSPNFVVGVLVDRKQRPLPLTGRCSSPGRCRSGLTFVLTYLPPPASGALGDRHACSPRTCCSAPPMPASTCPISR